MQHPRPHVRSLLIANALVAAAVVGVFLARHAGAQDSIRAADVRARGDYTMVAGKSNSGPSSIVYVIDSANQEAVALRWDATKQAMVGSGYRNIQTDSRAARGR